MSSPEAINLAPDAMVIFGKPAHFDYGDALTRIGESLAQEEVVVEAHLPQYFVLGSMPAPRLSLVLVARDVSQQAGVALRAKSILENLSLAQLVTDVWIMREDDRLLPSVRRAKCPIDL